MVKLDYIVFILFSLVIVVFAYLPAFGIDATQITNPNCALTGTCTRYVDVISNLQRTTTQQWVITDVQVNVGGTPNPQPFDIAFPSGQISGEWRLYSSDGKLLQKHRIYNTIVMDLTGLNTEYSNWPHSWEFSKVANGEYSVGVQYYENDKAITGEVKRSVTVT